MKYTRFSIFIWVLFLGSSSLGEEITKTIEAQPVVPPASKPSTEKPSSPSHAQNKEISAQKPKSPSHTKGKNSSKKENTAKKEPTTKKSSNASNQQLLARIAAVQAQYDATNSATFDFTQSYTHPFLTLKEHSEGTVAYERKPGNMLWSYLKPETRQKKFFINGIDKKFTYYAVSDKIAYTHACYEQDTLSASISFLTGSGNLKESFTILPLEGKPPHTKLFWMTLVPKETGGPVKKIVLGVNNDGRVLESIVVDPSDGKNHFTFSNFKANPKIDQGVFTFTAPKGVIVQPMPNVICPEEKKAAPTSSAQTKTPADSESAKAVTPPKSTKPTATPAKNTKISNGSKPQKTTPPPQATEEKKKTN